MNIEVDSPDLIRRAGSLKGNRLPSLPSAAWVTSVSRTATGAGTGPHCPVIWTRSAK